MIFEELTLTDFRQFAGTQSVKFATDAQKNITVIHGFNGSGKTTILNAFTWLLYGECSPDFDEPDRLESESSFAGLAPGGKLVTEVKAVFRDGDRKFTAVRTMSLEKDNNGSRRVTERGKLRLIFIDELGEAQEPSNPQDTLEQMLPKRLFPFFFFNGERIDRLAGASALFAACPRPRPAETISYQPVKVARPPYRVQSVISGIGVTVLAQPFLDHAAARGFVCLPQPMYGQGRHDVQYQTLSLRHGLVLHGSHLRIPTPKLYTGNIPLVRPGGRFFKGLLRVDVPPWIPNSKKLARVKPF